MGPVIEALGTTRLKLAAHDASVVTFVEVTKALPSI